MRSMVLVPLFMFALIFFTRPDGSAIWIESKQVVAAYDTPPTFEGKTTIVLQGGPFFTVRESLDAVVKRIKGE